VKRAKFLWPLTQGHHHGLMASLNIRDRLQADPTDASLAEEVRVFQGDDLEPHFQAEEDLLDELAERWGSNDEDLVRTRREHAELKALSSSGTAQDLLCFGDLLGRHIRYEEEVLFARFEGALTEEESRRWGERFQKAVSSDPKFPRRHKPGA